jgi:hypothetical protein
MLVVCGILLSGGINMSDLYGRDPEEVGPEHPDDLNARMKFVESRHWYEEGENDFECGAWALRFCYEHKIVDDCKPCGAQKSSVLHFDYDDRHDMECHCNSCSI